MLDKLVEVIRNGMVESIHTGNIAVVNQKGELTNSFGNPEQFCYFRSSGKPLILLSHLTKRIHKAFGLTPKELAIMTSSHNGSKEHVETLIVIAKKIGVAESDLICGIREPYGMKERFELFEAGLKPTQWHNNCSGKHLGNIAACKVQGLATENYWDIEHPIQKDILNLIAVFSGFPKESIHIGIDGCGVPVFGVPLKNMAMAYVRLFDTGFMNGKYKNEQLILHKAVTEYPEMVAGEGRLDTELIRVTKGEHFGKMGADGVFCVHIHSKGLGIAVKVQDGAVRAVDPIIIETLQQLNTLDAEMLAKLNQYHYPPTLTWVGKRVGFINPVFVLKPVKDKVLNSL